MLYYFILINTNIHLILLRILYYNLYTIYYTAYIGNIQNLAGPRGTFLARLFIATETITLNMRTIFTAPESIVSYRRFIYNAIYDFIMYFIVCYKECIRTYIVCIHYIYKHIVKMHTGGVLMTVVLYMTYSNIAHTYDKWKGTRYTCICALHEYIIYSC